MQIFSDFSEKNNKNNKSSGNCSDDDENLFGFGLSEKYFPLFDESDNKILRAKGYSYAPITNIATTRKNKNYYVSGTNPSYSKYTKNYYDPVKTKAAQENYKNFVLN